MKSVLVYTVHKAASMFLHRLTAEVAREFEFTYYSINYERDSEAIRRDSWKSFIESEDRRGCFGPIRAGVAEPAIPDDLQSYNVILHLRDPRDVLTSLFFSHVYSHARAPGQFNPTDEQRKGWEQGGIDKFVLEKAPQMLAAYRGLCTRLLGKENVLFVKYETMTSNYAEWLGDYLSAFAHFETRQQKLFNVIRFPNTLPRIQKRLYKKHRDEFTVSAEDMQQHKRQITPGDYRRKLSSETIGQLNRLFGEVLEMLEYQHPEPVAGPHASGI